MASGKDAIFFIRLIFNYIRSKGRIALLLSVYVDARGNEEIAAVVKFVSENLQKKSNSPTTKKTSSLI